MIQLSTALKLLLTLMTVPVTGTIDLSPIDNTDGEWVAPGYEVITELDFDPLEYVDYVQAAQAFFMDTEDGEQLRLILVGDNRVLVFDEPWDTYRECTLESPWEVKNVVFSRNGRFLAITGCKDSTYNDGFFEREMHAYRDFRIEITDEDILLERLNSNLGGYFVSNDGRICTTSNHGLLSLYPLGDVDEYMSREPRQEAWNRYGCSYDASLIVYGNVLISNGTIGIQGYDWSGDLLWETSIGDMVLTAGLTVSPSGEYVLVPTRDNGIICFSGRNGQKLWETGDSRQCSSIQVSPDGNRWVGSLPAMHFYTGITTNSIETFTLDSFRILSTTMQNPICLNLNNIGNSMFRIYLSQNSDSQRLVLLDSAQNKIWASSESVSRFSFHNSMNLADLIYGNTIAAISEDGNRICYNNDNETIKVLRIEEGQ